MRLINTKTYAFEEFIGRKIPKYAILSHTWEEEEVTFADFTSKPRVWEKKGWAKIDKTCKMASQNGYQYAWVDTCCIDKSSSAELTEAINSMFRWYQRAELCYAFLSDLPARTPGSSSSALGLRNCRWFTRGWTLQELIAPRHVQFFDQNWIPYGDKDTLSEELQSITGINPLVLNHGKSLTSITVAEKMSWAASRETTRIEDTAYCLLGIFNVNIPLLYGEEEKAFRRLQEEIIRTTPDRSIFAWRLPKSPAMGSYPETFVCGVLADSPQYFAGCGSLKKATISDSQEFAITHRGVKIQSRDVLVRRPDVGDVEYKYVLPLDCEAEDTDAPLGIQLRASNSDEFVRHNPINWVSLADDGWEWIDGGHDWCPETRYILASLPDIDLDGRGFYAPGDSYILESADKTPYLQISQPTWAVLEKAWPLGSFDLHDQTFVTRDWSDEVYAMVELETDVNTMTGIRTLTEKTELPFVFLAIGSGSYDTESWEFSLVDATKHAVGLKKMEEFLREPRWSRMRHRLAGENIPKLTADIIEVPDTDQVVLVSYTVTLVTNKNQVSVSKVSFTRELYDKTKVPWSRRIEREWGI